MKERIQELQKCISKYVQFLPFKIKVNQKSCKNGEKEEVKRKRMNWGDFKRGIFFTYT